MVEVVIIMATQRGLPNLYKIIKFFVEALSLSILPIATQRWHWKSEVETSDYFLLLYSLQYYESY